jgi:hypothetical protein
MSKRIVYCAALVMALFLVPGISHARLYNVNSGRFMTMDTYEEDKQDPQSLHKYVYGSDNPVDGSDPSGNFDVDFNLGNFVGDFTIGGIVS